MPNQFSVLSSLQPIPGRNSRITTVQQIYQDLRHLIIDLSLLPGAVLSKKDIAERFGVSQTPVREALILLEEDGLVDIFPQSRTEVSRIDVQHAREVHFLRLSVEIEVIRTLSQNISEQDLSILQQLIDRQSAELGAGDYTAFKLADNRFHEEMFRIAGVHGLTKMIERRRGHHDRIRGLYLLEQERRHTVIREHKEILNALKDQDAGVAETAVREHLGKSLAIIDQIQDRYPNYFS
jgi:DNA-binding GntR family transcriptional regulator